MWIIFTIQILKSSLVKIQSISLKKEKFSQTIHTSKIGKSVSPSILDFICLHTYRCPSILTFITPFIIHPSDQSWYKHNFKLFRNLFFDYNIKCCLIKPIMNILLYVHNKLLTITLSIHSFGHSYFQTINSQCSTASRPMCICTSISQLTTNNTSFTKIKSNVITNIPPFVVIIYLNNTRCERGRNLTILKQTNCSITRSSYKNNQSGSGKLFKYFFQFVIMVNMYGKSCC